MKYPVITLCGSTRFKEEFIQARENLARRGYIVLSPDLFTQLEEGEIPADIVERLDEIHRQRIDMSDMIYVINKNGYIGSSTRREIAYATSKKKEIHYMEEFWY